jgi:signal transduction histidine kinase
MRYDISIVKGLAFIILTSILLYYLGQERVRFPQDLSGLFTKDRAAHPSDDRARSIRNHRERRERIHHPCQSQSSIRYSDGSKIEVQVSSDNEWYLVNVDEVQIGLAFSNLISNALASAPSGIVLEASLSYQEIHSGKATSIAPTSYVVVNLEAPKWISQRTVSGNLKP